MKFYDELKWRDMIKDVSNEALAEKLFTEGKFSFYTGFDPTFKSLTVGHLVQIIRIKFMEMHGFKPVVLIGGATGLIGDPREVGERKLLDLETTTDYANKIKNQLSKLLNSKNIKYVNNYDWIKNIDVITFLRVYGKLFNINYMLAKDVVKTRLSEGISFTEFSYMILQSLDFYTLYKNENVKVQFGGSDQWGNITSGLELIRKLEGDVEVLGISSPLLLKADGKKFGKSEKGALFLDAELTSPYEIYQYFLNAADEDLLRYFKVLTLLPKEEIENVLKEHFEKPHLRLGQTLLASEIIKFLHGEKEILKVKKITETLFNGKFNELSEQELKMLFNSKNAKEIKLNLPILNLIVNLEAAKSNREAREFLKSNAINLNGKIISDEKYTLLKNDLLYNKYLILKRGKKNFYLGVLK